MRRMRNPGRVAGLWYLLLVLLGPVRLIYIPNKLFVSGDAAATVGNILAHERLFRLGIASELTGAVVLVLLTVALYRLLAGVDRTLAVLVVIFGGVMPGVIFLVGVVYDLSALLMAHGPDFLAVFSKPQRDALATLLLRMRDFQNTAAETLWGGCGCCRWHGWCTDRAFCRDFSASGWV